MENRVCSCFFLVLIFVLRFAVLYQIVFFNQGFKSTLISFAFYGNDA